MPNNSASVTAGLDRLGMVASTTCFIHCLATPVILSMSAVYAHFLPSEEHTHRGLAILVTLVGAISLGFGYRRHKRHSVLWLMAAALTLIFSGAFLGDKLPSHWAEVAITLMGSCCMILAHRFNHTFCRSCRNC